RTDGPGPLPGDPRRLRWSRGRAGVVAAGRAVFLAAAVDVRAGECARCAATRAGVSAGGTVRSEPACRGAAGGELAARLGRGAVDAWGADSGAAHGVSRPVRV